MMLPDKPFPPRTLADRWDCSPEFIYKLIREGDPNTGRKLCAFRLCGKILRIAHNEVVEWESGGKSTGSENTGSGSSADKAARAGTRRESGTHIALASVWRQGGAGRWRNSV